MEGSAKSLKLQCLNMPHAEGRGVSGKCHMYMYVRALTHSFKHIQNLHRHGQVQEICATRGQSYKSPQEGLQCVRRFV